MSGTTEATLLRTFVAVEISPEIRERLIGLKQELAATRAEVRWVRDDAMHLTLQFLGRTEANLVPKIEAGLAEVARETSSIDVRVRGLGAFPGLRRPRVIWAGAESDRLTRLASGVERVTGTLGFAAEDRPFRAHITLGRVKGTRRLDALAQALRVRADLDFGTCTVSEMILFRSDLRPEGAVYTKLCTVCFGR